MPATTEELLDKSRRELLDLSTRNRLLSIPVGSSSARIVAVRDEISEQVYRLLVGEKKAFSFLPREVAVSTADETGESAGGDTQEDLLIDPVLSQPENEDLKKDIDEATGLPKRHVDCRLQTSLSSEGLQRRLLDLYHDSHAMIEEAGVNILYLALGHLQWFEADAADTPRFAPLILVPVELSRKTASEKFTLRWTEEDIVENLSLYAKLKEDFGIELPDFENDDDFDIAAYFEAVSTAIAEAKNWEVLPDEITLGFFSFAKFLMFRDLDPKAWPTPSHLINQPLVAGLLLDGFPQTENIFSDDSQLDEMIPVAKLDHVVDADSTQTLAIESVRQGRSMVVQGPPGTGKSQSITNIIAAAVMDGKRVLFVAEKLAALQVVQRRLQNEGLGALCLELHSNKSKKKTVIEELGKTWMLGKPQPRDLESLIPKLHEKRSILNQHAKSIHEQYKQSGLTPFTIIGHLSLLEKRGLKANELTFTSAGDWTAEQRRTNRGIIEDLAQRIDQIGLPAQHPWRGTNITAILQIDLDPLSKRISQASAVVTSLLETTSALAENLSQPIPETFTETDEQLIIAGYVVSAPKIDKEALCNATWDADLEPLRDLVAEGQKFSNVRKQTEKQIIEKAWEKDFSEQRQQIAARGQSLLRIFNSKYRAAIAEIKGVMKGKLPKTYADRLAFIDGIIIGQQSLRKLREHDELGRSAFGSLWREEKSDWEQFTVILGWVAQQIEAGLSTSFRHMFAGITDTGTIAKLVGQLKERLTTARETTQKLFTELSVDYTTTFANTELNEIALNTINERLKAWVDSINKLPAWTTYALRAQYGRKQGLNSLISVLENGKIPTKEATDSYDRIYFSQLLRSIARQKPELAHFDGELHERYVAEFRQLDRERLALAKYRALMAHYERMPPHSAVGAAGIVRSEMERKRGHRTVRRLLKDAGSVVQCIKPVFMMSPLSVAQFLEPGTVEFDLLVIDEASQVQPVDALGAIARCKQIVVIGDSKQLPPTKFFARLTSDIEDYDEDGDDELQAAQVQDIESILGLCKARGLPEKMLRWHYRSRHHSLIAVSNHEFYNDQLFIVPSPFELNPELGLKFHFVEGGVFDAGVSATNRVEAKAVCRAIIEHARNSPELSLGVAAFSVKQQKAIRNELELIQRQNPEIEEFFAAHPTEPFFCKNLENVQGDERDVIFISVGYGKNASGYMAMRFGPLGNEGGERRLNVLISRAKKRCHVFTSITADDIDLERAKGRGVASLKVFLAYAESGKLSVATISGREEESPFEESVRRAVEGLGYEVVPQVGEAGFFIDLGVRDRQTPGRFILGIECDGATYHSSRSARDRDRLRQAVLEDHGWVIHRVWSTDWLQRQTDQLRKIAAAIEAAKIGKTNYAAKTETNGEIIRDEALPKLDDDSLAKLAVPYVEAHIEVPTRQEPHTLSFRILGEIILKIVQVEGPIHEDEITNRVKALWGFARAGSRIQRAVKRGIGWLMRVDQCISEDGFLSINGYPIPIRNRENVSSPDLRKPERIAPSELRAAILAVIELGHGAAQKEIPTAVARILGFKNTSAQLRYAVEEQIHKLVKQNVITENSGMFKHVC